MMKANGQMTTSTTLRKLEKSEESEEARKESLLAKREQLVVFKAISMMCRTSLRMSSRKYQSMT